MESGDSDNGISRPRRTDDSDIEAQLILDQESASLQAANDSLRKENSLLRAQFDQAVSLTQGLDELHQKNAKLASAVRALESDKADLSRRLELSLRANEELASHISAEKESYSQRLLQDTAEKDKEIARLTQNSDSTISALRNRLREAEESHERDDISHRMLTSKVEHLLQTRNIDALSISPVMNTPINPVDSKLEALNEQLGAALAKIKRDKRLLKSARRESESLKTEIVKLQRESSAIEQNAAQQTKHFESLNVELREEYETKIAEDSKTIQDISAKNELRGWLSQWLSGPRLGLGRLSSDG
jgi:cell shape-determining protein MreC